MRLLRMTVRSNGNGENRVHRAKGGREQEEEILSNPMLGGSTVVNILFVPQGDHGIDPPSPRLRRVRRASKSKGRGEILRSAKTSGAQTTRCANDALLRMTIKRLGVANGYQSHSSFTRTSG